MILINEVYCKMTKKAFRTVEADGWIIYKNENGKVHRDDGPAMIAPNGYQSWYKNDIHHRDNGPAAILPNGTQYWYKNGKLYRKNGPALIWANGIQIWFKNDKYHRKIKMDPQ